MQEHHSQAEIAVSCAVLTVSDTRTLETDRSGALAQELLTEAGYEAKYRRVVPDDSDAIAAAVRELVRSQDYQAVLVTGGTGVAPRDVTPEAVAGLFSKSLPGYGELFRQLSYEEIGPAAMLSRAEAGLIDRTAVFTMPGSTAAVRLAIEKIIAPELRHLMHLAQG